MAKKMPAAVKAAFKAKSAGRKTSSKGALPKFGSPAWRAKFNLPGGRKKS